MLNSVTSKPITVIVGEDDDGETFYLHEDAATKHSRFFAAALANGWKESEERTIRLPDEDPEDFSLFARFNYSGIIHSKREGDADEDGDGEWVRLADSWILGDKLLATTFKDAIIDSIVQKAVKEGNVPP